MIDLGATEFNLAIPSIARTELEAAAIRLFDKWDKGASIALSLDDYSISLVVEEGSIKGRGAIMATAAVLYLGIGNYGDFIQGLKTINEQLIGVRDYLAEEAPKFFDCPPNLVTTKKQTGVTEKLNSLFLRVQRGDLSPDQATARAAQLFTEGTVEESNILREIERALANCRLNPKQTTFPYDDFSIAPEPQGVPQSPTRTREKQTPIDIISNQLRVEVWRESKKKKKQSKVTFIG
jgi:hypothetical protein